MKISLVYLTYRPGGIDMLADSVARQNYSDFEVVIIDDYKIDRRKEIRDYFAEIGIDNYLSYVGKSKKKCFEEVPYGLINAYNTGALKSKGEIIVYINDYTWLPEDAVRKWLKYEDELKNKKAICGIALYWLNAPERLKSRFSNGNISVWSDFAWRGSPERNGWNTCAPWISEFELFYIGMHSNLLDDMNGFPECLDCQPSYQTEHIKKVIKDSGGSYTCHPDLICEMIDHRQWPAGDGIYKALWTLQKTTEFQDRPNCFDFKKDRTKAVQ